MSMSTPTSAEHINNSSQNMEQAGAPGIPGAPARVFRTDASPKREFFRFCSGQICDILLLVDFARNLFRSNMEALV